MRKLFSNSEKLPLIKDIAAIGPVTFVTSFRARRINLTVRATGEIRVAVPAKASLRTAEQFVISKQDWIKRQLKRVQERESFSSEYLEKIKSLEIDSAAAEIFERLDELASEFDFSYNRVTIRNQKTRWGSCSAKNNLSLNIKLAILPEELRDLILVHELVHTRIKNHGPDFWQKLESIYPDARELDRQVNQLGGLLRVPLGLG